MSEQVTVDSGIGYSTAIDTNSLEAFKSQSASTAEVGLGVDRGAGTESPSPTVELCRPETIVVSLSDPTNRSSEEVQWFEPFEIRRRKGVPEIAVRMVHGSIALFLSLLALGEVVGICIRFVRMGHQGFQPDSTVYYIGGVILVLAIIMVFVTLRRFLYWKVDQVGVHQYCFGFKQWSLAWNDIVSRRLGPMTTPTWLFLLIVPIAGGEYQPIIMKDRQGRKRRINRLGTNGDRLDGILRQYVNSTSQARQARVH